MTKSIYSLGPIAYQYQRYFTCPHEGERNFDPYTREWRCESCENKLSKFREFREKREAKKRR